MYQIQLDIKKACLLFASMLFICINAPAQQSTYIVDPGFNTGNLFRDDGPVMEIIPIEDNRILVGGGFQSSFFGTAFNSIGIIYEDGLIYEGWDNLSSGSGTSTIIVQDDGYIYPYIQSINKKTLDGGFWFWETGAHWCEYVRGGIFSPYNVQSVWTVYEQDDGKILLGGAIGNDTLQPFVLRNLVRVEANGNHDSTFPPIECEPYSSQTRVTDIYQASDGSWFISGNFHSVNAHTSNHIAKLTPNFEVDTTYVSPFVYEGLSSFYHPRIRLLDSQDRLWLSSQTMRLIEAPEDTIQVIRVLSDGIVDEDFTPRYLRAEYPQDWWGWSFKQVYINGVVALESHPGNYLLYGQFNVFDNQPQNCITVVNDAGEIQENFFQGQGAAELNYTTFGTTAGSNIPGIHEVFELENGDLLVGGSFSDFMGTTHYNMIKLNLGVLTSDGLSELDRKFKLYPNPSSTFVNLAFEGLVSGQISIINLIGQVVETHQMFGPTLRLDSSKLPKGVYFVSLETTAGKAVKKMVVN